MTLVEHHLFFLDHPHQLDAGEGVLRRIKRFKSQHRSGHSFYSSMILLDDVIQIFGLTDFNRGTMFLIIALNRGFIGRAAVDGDLLRHPAMTANRLIEKFSRRFLISLLSEQTIKGLAEFVDGPVEIFPLALDFDISLIHAPTRPHGALAPVKFGFKPRTVFDHPAIHRGVVYADTALFHQFFDVAGAQRVREVPAHAHENDLRWEMGPFETHRHRLAPS